MLPQNNKKNDFDFLKKVPSPMQLNPADTSLEEGFARKINERVLMSSGAGSTKK